MEREEAINNLKKVLGFSPTYDEAFYTLFPEFNEESEDERIRKAIIELLKEIEQDDTYCGLWHIKFMIAYLEKQKEPKPAEWSEKDERKIVELKTFIAKCNGFNKENRKKAFDMIDALRPQPQWKPTEEQMEAFECAERWYSDNMGCNIFLYQLLCDLKRLKYGKIY